MLLGVRQVVFLFLDGHRSTISRRLKKTFCLLGRKQDRLQVSIKHLHTLQVLQYLRVKNELFIFIYRAFLMYCPTRCSSIGVPFTPLVHPVKRSLNLPVYVICSRPTRIVPVAAKLVVFA